MKLKSRVFVILLAAAALGLPAALFLVTAEPGVLRGVPETRVSNARAVQSAYLAWRAQHVKQGGDRNLMIPLGWSKGRSLADTGATGMARLDLVSGFARIDVQGLTLPGAWDVWLVDNGEGTSAMPDPGDRMHRLGTLVRVGGRATLATRVEPRLYDGFDVDVVVVSPAGARPEEQGLLYGAPDLFQRLYRRETRPAAPGSFPALLASVLGPRPAFAAGTIFNSTDPLVAKGADLFFNETFGGNGRTCSTCHPAENNFTIDPNFIDKLPANDELFIFEASPGLDNLENPILLRELGLITVNADGFTIDKPAVFRAVPHLLGLSRYLTPGNQAVPPIHRTGWGGDGAPGSGTIREFPLGAVAQHFTKGLDRIEGTDFRLPTDEELDALEAFTRGIGRQDNPDIDTLQLKGVIAEKGRLLFLSEKSQCTFCHLDAGANGPFEDQNRNFDIGIEAMIDHPADLLAPGVRPPDGGFGKTPLFDPVTGAFLGFGDFDPEEDGNMRRFNSQAAIEAVDTGPFFHNHAVQTVEESVDFYNSDAFANSLAGGLAIHLETTEVEHIAAFMRVMNALENIRSASELAQAALEETDPATSRRLADLASFDAQDGHLALQERRLHRNAAFRLSRAHLRLKDASRSPGKAQRDFFLGRALAMMTLARNEMVLSE